MILSLPASIPDLVTLGPPIISRPLAVNVVRGMPAGPFTNTPKALTLVLTSESPVLIPKRSTVVTRPSPKGALEPILTLPVLPRSRLLFSATSILPFFTRVSMLLLEPTTSTCSPNGFITVLPSAAFKPKPLLTLVFKSPTAELVACN